MTRIEFIENKIWTIEEAKRKRALFDFKNEKVVFTNGCFDILHVGHLTYLAKAAQLGKRLIIGLNADVSVKQLGKGDNRPVNPELARAMVIAALGFVDGVVIFNEMTPENLIDTLQPDVLVKGGDYDENETNPSSKRFIVGSEYVKSYGGQVVTIPLVEGFSTTGLIERLQK